MAAPIRPANKPATETTPEMSRTGKCGAFKCECPGVLDPTIKIEWETCTRETCGHTTSIHNWAPVT